MTAQSWTSEATEKAKQMWVNGIGGTEIGLAVGKSREAVVAKMHRLGLAAGIARIDSPQGTEKPKPEAKPIQSAVTEVVVDEPEPVLKAFDAPSVEPETKPDTTVVVREKVVRAAADGSEGILIMTSSLTRHCQYALWDDDDTSPITEKRVCGCRVVTGKTWCRTHYGIVFDLNSTRSRISLPKRV